MKRSRRKLRRRYGHARRKHTYSIRTDAASLTLQATSANAAARAFDGSSSSEALRHKLERLGGYGSMERDGEVLWRVR